MNKKSKAVLVAAALCFSMALNAQSISLRLKGVTVRTAINALEQQSNYSFVYEGKAIDTERRVNVNAKTVAEAASQILKGQNVEYVIKGKTIVVSPKAKHQSRPVGQRKKITGVVVDNEGLPAIGASVKVRGSKMGVVTDIDGKFSIDANEGVTLVVSSLGYRNQEIVVDGKNDFSIKLVPEQKQLNEVVVTALGIKKESKALSYNVQQISSSELTGVKDANFVNSLNGKIAGVTINSSSSGIGGAARVVMRGTKSISGNNNALYVVDGIPLPSLQNTQPSDLYTGMGQSGDGISMINPEDIESVSVLSGASGAALYGSEAANGVVMITTKKGNKNTFAVNYSNSTQFYSPFVMPEFQHTYGSEQGSYQSWGEKLKTPSNYDPEDFFRTGYNEVNALSVAIGNDKSQTYASMSATNAGGIIQNNDLGRYNFAIRNSSSFLNDKLNLDLSAMYMKTKENNMLAQGQYFNPLVPIYLFPQGDNIDKYRAYERYDADRNFKVQYWPYGDQGFQMQNPYWIINRDNFVNHKDRYLLSGALKYNILSWLNITGRARMDYSTSIFEKKYSASTSGLFAGKYGAYYRDDTYTHQIYADLMLNVNKYFGDFSLTANLGTSMQDVKYEYTSLGGNLMSVANLFAITNLDLANAKPDHDGYHDNQQAVFATVQLGWKSRLYLDLTGRNDWISSLAGTDAKSIFYPSAGVSAIWTDLLGFKSDVLPFLKTRFSYSEVGNAPTRFLTNPTYPLASGYPNTTTFLPNTELKPERTKSYELGINAQLFGGKLKLDLSLYSTQTYNQLFKPTLSSTSGYSGVYVNAGRVDNKGIEASVSFNQKLGPVDWTTGLVYSLNRNKIKKLLRGYKAPDGEIINMTEMDMGGTDAVKARLTEGGSMGDIYVTTLKTDEHGYIDVDYTQKTVEKDPNKWVYAGNVNPLYNLGWRNEFNWNGINLAFLVNARVGGRVVSITQAIMDAYGVSKASADARDQGGALVNGQLIPAKNWYTTIGGGTSGVGSQYVYSATNVRLAELSVGYDVPVNKWVSWIKGFNVSFVGRNLLMFYRKAPFDPELTASTGTYYQGIDYFMQPSLRSLGFAVKLNF